MCPIYRYETTQKHIPIYSYNIYVHIYIYDTHVGFNKISLSKIFLRETYDSSANGHFKKIYKFPCYYSDEM